MERSKDITFRRVRGRIVPIKKKKSEDLKGTAKLGSSFAVAAGSSFLSAKQIVKSNKFFNQSALLRGARKLLPPGSDKSKQLAKEAIDMARKGGRATGKGKFILFAGSVVTGALAASGLGDLLKRRTDETTRESIQTLGSIGAGLGAVALFNRQAGIKGLKESLKASLKSGSPDEQLALSFDVFESAGRMKTKKLIKKFETARYKATNVPKGTQLDLFNKPKKKFNIKNFLKEFK